MITALDIFYNNDINFYLTSIFSYSNGQIRSVIPPYYVGRGKNTKKIHLKL